MIIIKQLATKPVPPADDDCCGGGACAPCVWDQYYADLEQWQKQQAKSSTTANQQQDKANI